MISKRLFFYFFVFLSFLLLVFSSQGQIFSSLEAKEEILLFSFLDVGQGDASFIQSSYGQNILIDGGEDSRIIEELSRLMGFFDRKIDLMILSHPHADHVGGLIEVLRRYDVEKVLYSGRTHNSPEYITFLGELARQGIDVLIIDHPQKIRLGRETYLNILYPFDKSDTTAKRSLNNNSILVKLVHGEKSILLTGDLEAEMEDELLSLDLDLEADVLKLAHHGSDTSNTNDFLEAVSPDIALIGVGKDNYFGHPSKRVEKRLEEKGVKILRTDQFGTINLSLSGSGIKYLP